MQLNEFQKGRCLKIVEKMINLPICSPFREMVDPERDGAPDYFTYISEPMALCEVKKRLIDDKYKTLEAFKRDINLIWENAITYNGEETLYAYMAKEANLWFMKKMNNFPSSAMDEWIQKVCRTAKDFFDTLTNLPMELDSKPHKDTDDRVKRE